jgi:hypothetical protein
MVSIAQIHYILRLYKNRFNVWTAIKLHFSVFFTANIKFFNFAESNSVWFFIYC